MASRIHDDRRREIAAISCRVIATRGLDGLTIRTVAAEVGYSTAVVTHYFHNKRDLLLHTYEHAAARSVNRAGEGPLPDALWDYCAQLLPVDPISVENWRVFVAFWGAASGDAELAERQRGYVCAAREQIAVRLRSGYAMAPEPAAEQSRRLLAAVMGIATQALFDPDEWPPARQLRTLAGLVEGLLQRS